MNRQQNILNKKGNVYCYTPHIYCHQTTYYNYMIHVAIEPTSYYTEHIPVTCISTYYLLLHWLPWRLEGMPGQGCRVQCKWCSCMVCILVCGVLFETACPFPTRRVRFQHAVCAASCLNEIGHARVYTVYIQNNLVRVYNYNKHAFGHYSTL